EAVEHLQAQPRGARHAGEAQAGDRLQGVVECVHQVVSSIGGGGLRKKLTRRSARRSACQWIRATTPRVMKGWRASHLRIARPSSACARPDRRVESCSSLPSHRSIDTACTAPRCSKRKRYSPRTGKKGETWKHLVARSSSPATIGRWSGWCTR